MTRLPGSGMAATIGIPFTDQPLVFLAAAVRSVFAQTHQNWTLLLVADGASQENITFARSIRDSRVRVVVFEEREGLARRLNDIAAMAETPYLFRMDGDDIMHPERVERQIALLEAGAADLVGSRAYLIDSTDHIYGLMKESPALMPPSARYLDSDVVLMHPTLAATTEWFRANPYDPSLLRAEDKALFIATASSTRMAKMADPLLFYRVVRPIPPRPLHHKFDRLVMRRYGHMVASPPTIFGYVAKSYIKQAVIGLASNFGGPEYLFLRKIDSLDADSMRHAEDALNAALAAPIPG